MKKKLLLLAALLIAGLAVSFMVHERADAPVHGEETLVLTAPDGRRESVAVEIADDEAERARGLMERESLPAGTGMLFVYDTAFELGFWMKNTNIPLDILFFDAEGTFVSRLTMDPCVTERCPTYPSGAPARYALEVNRGESVTADVGPGWRMERSPLD